MKNVRAKLVINGDSSESRVMSISEYESFIRTCSQLDFDTHLAIDLDLDAAELEAMQAVVRDIEGLQAVAVLKLASNE